MYRNRVGSADQVKFVGYRLFYCLSPAEKQSVWISGRMPALLQVIEHGVINAAINGSINVHHYEPITHRFCVEAYNFVASEWHSAHPRRKTIEWNCRLPEKHKPLTTECPGSPLPGRHTLLFRDPSGPVVRFIASPAFARSCIPDLDEISYSSTLRPISISALEGILKRSIACAELRDMKENNATRQRDRIWRCLRLTRSFRSI